MGTKLEQLQAAAKAKLASGQKLTATPIAAPQVNTTVASPVKTTQPVAAPKVSTATAPSQPPASPAIQAEIQRKASLGIPLTNTANAANNAAYSQAAAAKTPTIASTPTPTMKAPTTAPTTPTAAPNTAYVANGGQTLNDLLYLKRAYESGKTGAAGYATPLYSKLDPQTAALVKGMNAPQLEAYIMRQNGASGQGTGQGAGQDGSQGIDAGVNKFQSQAKAAYEQEQAMMDAAAAANVKELERRYNYSTGVTRDNRVLEDGSFNRNNAPVAWDGSTGYRGAMMDRNRSIEDHYSMEGLTDAEAAAYSQANAFRNQSGNYITTKSAELENADKQYNLQVAGLTGEFNGQQTMQGKAAAADLVGQNIANQIAKIDLTNYPQTSKLQIQKLQQDVASGKISNDAAAYQLTQLTDPNSTTNQAQALDLRMKQIDASNYSTQQKLQLEQLRKTVAEIGKIPYQSETDRQLDELKVQQAYLELEKLQQGTQAAGKVFEDYQSNIEKIVQRDKKGVITNPDTIEDYILNSDMSEYEMYRAYGVYGLKWGGEVPTKGE